MQSVDRYSPFALFVIFIASCGGFLFGYHTAIISGVLGLLANTFHLNVLQEGFLVSILLLGGVVGALFAGVLSDRWGRRNVMFLTTLIFLIGAVILAITANYHLFLAARVIIGIGVGIASLVSPLYLAEVAPPHYRGRFVCLFQIMVAAGILAAYGINALFAQQDSWRVVFWISLIPAGVQLVGLFFIPESPGWLFRKGRPVPAEKALAVLRGDLEWKKHLSEMQMSGTRQYGKRKWEKRLIFIITVGFLLSAFQQITGINTVIYYAPTIFGHTGASSAESALVATLAVGIANFLVTFIAVWLIDKIGRRILLLIGVLGMAVCLGMLIFVLQVEKHPLLAVISVVGYVSFFALSLGPVTWVVLSEIFPLQIRGFAMGLALFSNWFFNYIVSLTFLLLIQHWGISGTFALYTGISLLCFFFIFFCIPETKGKSLEEIEHMLTRRKV